MIALRPFHFQFHDKQTARMQNKKTADRLKIAEIFHSIQGESTLAGERFSFVRLSGCPLRCRYCDTAYAFAGGTWKNAQDIIEKVDNHGTKHVLITGGEPLAQRPLALVEALSQAGKRVSIETNGEQDVKDYCGKAKLIMDIKTPASGERAERCFSNLQWLTSSDEIKFVLCNRSDYDWAQKICDDYHLTQQFAVLFSVASGSLAIAELASWILEDKLDVRLQPQLHKWIWGPDAIGV